MRPLTIRVRENTKESIDSEASEYGLSVSEYIRELIEYGREYYGQEEYIAELEARADECDEIEAERDQLAADVEELEAELADRADPGTLADLRSTIDDLENEVDHLEARNRDLTNQLAEANRRIDTTNELVKRVDKDLTARERREERERRKAEAGIGTRLKWSLFGMPTETTADSEE